MKKILLAMIALCFMALPGALSEQTTDGLLLHLAFDEGGGSVIRDLSGHLPDEDVQYQYLAPVFTEPMDPQWRSTGVEGGSLLFDGCSTCIAWPAEDLCLSGTSVTVSVWVAPRAFEWDDPDAAEQGNAHLTAILGQYYKPGKEGILLGYQRFGRLCVEIGTGDHWYTLWADDERLVRNEWNHVAAVFDGEAGKVSLYLNGAEATSMDIPAGSCIEPARNESLLIGKNAYGEQIGAGNFQMFCGLMDELKVFDRALDAQEIAALAAPDVPVIDYNDIAPENILTGDPWKTQYHGGPYQHWMNEPHAPLYYNGMYHLFFQSNSIGTYWRNICWGHLVSDDTVHWRPIRDAIVPTENSAVPDGVWSGCAALDRNGIPVLFFTAGNDSFRKEGLISNQNIGAARPADLNDPELTEWVISGRLAVEQQPGQGRPGEFRDPHIWKEGDRWYMLVCSGSSESTGGSALLYVTDTLEVRTDGTIDMAWEYKGPVFEMPDQPATYGTSWELPILLPLRNKTGTVTKYAFFISPAPAGIADNKVYYWVGEFDREGGKFIPDGPAGSLPRMLDYGSNVFTGPSVLADPVTGRICMFSIMQDQRTGPEEGAAGWAHCVGLTRNVYLNEEGTDVCVEPDPRLYGLLDEKLVSLKDVSLEKANEDLSGVRGDLLYIKAVIAPQESRTFGLTCKAEGRRNQTTFTYYADKGTVEGFTGNRGKAAPVSVISGPLPLKDGELTMEIFIDRSLAEGFFNGDKAISIRSYAPEDAQGIQLFSDADLLVKELSVYTVRSIYP